MCEVSGKCTMCSPFLDFFKILSRVLQVSAFVSLLGKVGRAGLPRSRRQATVSPWVRADRQQCPLLRGGAVLLSVGFLLSSSLHIHWEWFVIQWLILETEGRMGYPWQPPTQQRQSFSLAPFFSYIDFVYHLTCLCALSWLCMNLTLPYVIGSC